MPVSSDALLAFLFSPNPGGRNAFWTNKNPTNLLGIQAASISNSIVRKKLINRFVVLIAELTLTCQARNKYRLHFVIVNGTDAFGQIATPVLHLNSAV